MKKLFVRLTSASCVAVMLIVALAIPTFAATNVLARSFTQQRAMTAVCNYNDATCDGRYAATTVGPNGQLCTADAQQPISVASNAVASVALFFSANCGTNWSVYSGELGTENANVQRLNSDGSITRYDTTAGSTFQVTSPMVFAPVLTARACGSANNDPATSVCTGFF